MNPAALGQLIAAAVGIAISPVSIATVIVLLLSRRAVSVSVGFLLGWSTGIAAALTVFTVISTVVPVRVPGANRTVLGIAQLVIGVVLLALGAIQWARWRRVEGDPLTVPAWMRVVDRTTPPVAFAVGLAMAVNPPNLILSLAGGLALGAAGLRAGAAIAAILLFTLLAASTVLIPVVGYAVSAEHLRHPLDLFRRWLLRHASVIVIVVLLAVGLFSARQGIATIAAG